MPTRLTWMVVGGAVVLVAKARTERAVAAEARRLHDRLPAPAARVLDHVPADLTRVGGAAVVGYRAARTGGRVGYRAAVVGGRTAATATSAATTAGRVSGRAGAAVGDAARRVRHAVASTRTTWEDAIEDEARLLRADLARLEGDGAAAVDALVDRRRAVEGLDAPADRRRAVEGPRALSPAVPDAVPDAVPAGRRRAGPHPVEGRPDRVQRSYRNPLRPW